MVRARTRRPHPTAGDLDRISQTGSRRTAGRRDCPITSMCGPRVTAGSPLNSGLDTLWSGFILRVLSIINCKGLYHASLMNKVDKSVLGFSGVDMPQPQDVAQSEDKLP